MKVKLLVNLGTSEFPATPFKDGETHDVTKKLGELLVKRNLAVDVSEPDAPPVAVAASTLPEEPASEPKPKRPSK